MMLLIYAKEHIFIRVTLSRCVCVCVSLCLCSTFVCVPHFRGAFSIVKKAVHISSKKEYAAKIINTRRLTARGTEGGGGDVEGGGRLGEFKGCSTYIYIYIYIYIQVLMRDEKEGKKSKQGQTNYKAKQHSTPKAVTFPKCTCSSLMCTLNNIFSPRSQTYRSWRERPESAACSSIPTSVSPHQTPV